MRTTRPLFVVVFVISLLLAMTESLDSAWAANPPPPLPVLANYRMQLVITDQTSGGGYNLPSGTSVDVTLNIRFDATGQVMSSDSSAVVIVRNADYPFPQNKSAQLTGDGRWLSRNKFGWRVFATFTNDENEDVVVSAVCSAFWDEMTARCELESDDLSMEQIVLTSTLGPLVPVFTEP